MRQASWFRMFLSTVLLAMVAPSAHTSGASPRKPRRATGNPGNDPDESGRRLTLAATTSTYDSGLLDAILPDFEAQTGVQVDVVAVGTGHALQLGMDGDADVMLVHARARENAFMKAGHGTRREDVMVNDFVLVGPAADPAGIAGMPNAAEALQAIAAAEVPFISRGDDSGTHIKERALWDSAGLKPEGDWYTAAGQGMNPVLTMASEQQAYALSDRATYLAMSQKGLDLKILVTGDPVLFNPYGVIAVNPDKHANVRAELANRFIDWLISVETQKAIGEFGTDTVGAPLFTPNSDPWNAAQR